MGCSLCPRRCGANRTKERGFCGADGAVRIARAAPHLWEEPCISGTRGSGAVFFCGCPLHCVFCQNADISAGGVGRAYSEEQLGALFLSLQAQGCHNLNLVTATPYANKVARVLERLRGQLTVPIVWNTGGYETIETLRRLSGLVHIYLPDLKYCDRALGAQFAGAADYFETATAAISEMVRQTGPCVFGADGLLQRGTVVRHLVLPGHRDDSIAVLRWLGTHFSKNDILLSLMWQYTPYRAIAGAPELSRRVTTFEYRAVAEVAEEYGFDGYLQEKDAALSCYTPEFDTATE